MSVQGDIKKEVIRYKLNRAEGDGGIQWNTVENSGEQWRTLRQRKLVLTQNLKGETPRKHS